MEIHVLADTTAYPSVEMNIDLDVPFRRHICVDGQAVLSPYNLPLFHNGGYRSERISHWSRLDAVGAQSVIFQLRACNGPVCVLSGRRNLDGIPKDLLREPDDHAFVDGRNQFRI